MKRTHLVISIMLIILGVSLIGASVYLFLIPACAMTAADAQILNIPTCEQVVTWMFWTGGVGLGSLIVAVVVMALGQETQSPQKFPAQGLQPGYVLCPHCAGQNYPTAVYCQWCSKPLRVQT